MKLIFYLIILFGLIAPFKGYTCVNEYEEDYTKPDGKYIHITDEAEGSDGYYFEHGFNTYQLEERKAELEELLNSKSDFKIESDYAVVLLKLGRYKEGLLILERLIKDHPEEYAIVVNLGTAYELNGKPELALKYIKKAVEINPDSHEGSEWIHIKILEAKLAAQADKDFLLYNSVLGLAIPGDIKNYYKNLNDEKFYKFNKIKSELEWQLKERISFVGPPDPIVADLLFDLANLIALTESIELAVPVYNKSLEYLPVNISKVLATRDSLIEKLYWTNFKKYSTVLVITFIVISLLLYTMVRMIKRRKKKKTVLDTVDYDSSK